MNSISRERIGVAFIGAGIVAEMHGRGVAASANARLLGAYDPRREKAKAIARRFGGRVYNALDDVFADARVQAVHILTSPEHHVSVALRALQHGKHVLVEKPVAATVAQIHLLQDAARKHHRICMPAHNFIYAPELQRAKRLIMEGKLGKIAALWILYNIFHPEKVAAIYGGVLREVCTHHAYSLLYLLGRPVRVAAMASCVHYQKLKCEDQVVITCEMADGAIANLWSSFAASDPTSDPWTVVFKVLGTRGGATYSWNEAQFDDQGGPAWGLPCYEDGYRSEIDHFINCVIREGIEPLSSLSDAADALRIIETAERAIKSGKREPVNYPQPTRAKLKRKSNSIK